MPRKSKKYESVVKVRLDRGGYVMNGQPDSGNYFGVGQSLYRGTCRESGRYHYVRANSRDEAIASLEK